MKRLYIIILFFIFISSLSIYSQPTQGLIGYWPLNGNANDQSGFNNHGTVYGATFTTDRFGNSNTAYSFNGINNYIDCGNNIPPFTNRLTVSVWIKTNSINPKTEYIVGKYGWTNGPIKGFHVIMNSLSVQFAWRDDIDEYNYTTSGALIINNNQWHHIVGTIDNSIYELWIDGVKIRSLSNNHPVVNLLQNYNLYIGGHFNHNVDQNMYFTGAIDDVRLYNRALNSTEILQLYNESKIPYTVTTSSSPTNSGTTSGSGTYYSGNYVTVTATPISGYGFLSWTENGNVVSTNASYTFPINSNRNLVANFVQQYVLTTYSNPSSGGTTIGGGIYNSGSTVTVIATPNQGYSFINWTEGTNIVSSSPTYSFTLNSNKNLTANFSLNSYTVTVYSNPVNGGTASISGTFTHGASVTVTATPSQNFIFINWTESGDVVSSNVSYTFILTSDKVLTANFLTVPNPPILNTPISISQTSFTAVWYPSSTATGYYIDVAIDDQFNNILASYNNKYVGDVLSYQISGLTPNTTFYIRVRAYNPAGISDNSIKISVTTLPNAPSAPIAKNATNLTPTGFTANWGLTSGATGYFIDIAIDQNFTNLLSNYNNKDVGNASSITISNLTTNFTYYYRVRAYNSGGTSSNSNSITVTIVTDIEKIYNNQPSSFELLQNYPNPFNPKTRIQFSIPKSSVVLLKVFNSLGQEVAELINQELPASTYVINFDASHLESGIYYYKLDAGTYSKTKKLVLVK